MIPATANLSLRDTCEMINTKKRAAQYVKTADELKPYKPIFSSFLVDIKRTANNKIDTTIRRIRSDTIEPKKSLFIPTLK